MKNPDPGNASLLLLPTLWDKRLYPAFEPYVSNGRYLGKKFWRLLAESPRGLDRMAIF